jgi:hypothetical protein
VGVSGPAGRAGTRGAASAASGGTPLARRLGYGPGMRVAHVRAPDGFAELLGAPPAGVRVLARPAAGMDLVVVFVTVRRELERRIAGLRDAVAPAGALWVAWPKRASGVPTDLTEDVVRDVALPTGLVDVKVCAIDATWSGLKLVVRRELR